MQITPVNYNYSNQKVQKNNQPSFGQSGLKMPTELEEHAMKIETLQKANDALQKKNNCTGRQIS